MAIRILTKSIAFIPSKNDSMGRRLHKHLPSE